MFNEVIIKHSFKRTATLPCEILTSAFEYLYSQHSVAMCLRYGNCLLIELLQIYC